MTPVKTGLIGCGKMGGALIRGAMQANALTPRDIVAYDAIPAALEDFTRSTGTTAATSLDDLVRQCDTLILCTKPGDVPQVLSTIAATTGSEPRLLLSVAAGVTLAALESSLPTSVRTVRSMPNTPALVGCGASAFCLGSRATRDDATRTRNILGAVGIALELPEKSMDAVTGLSGSGPAFVFLVIEALADGGVRAGLSRADALQLAAQTVLGSARMVLDTGLHPGELKDRVASPGGTTIEGIATLEQHGLRGALIDAVTAAARRSAELGRPSSSI